MPAAHETSFQFREVSGLVFFGGLSVIFLWRLLCPWRCCGRRLDWLNYTVALYFMLVCLLIVALYTLAGAFFEAQTSTGVVQEAHFAIVVWLKPLVAASPVAVCVTIVLCCIQASHHVDEIKESRSCLKHDRALQVIATPAVYGTMAMCALARAYQLAAGNDMGEPGLDFEKRQNLTLARYETCFFMADLYEAWALYQFGKLSLELARASMEQRTLPPEVAGQVRHGQSSEVSTAEDLRLSTSAVSALALQGTNLFILVCVCQAVWALWLWTFESPTKNWSEYESSMNQFSIAGLVSSFAAIYNVHIVETHYHHHLVGFKPLLKFISVKMLVSLAFLQREILFLLQAGNQVLPGVMKNISSKIPVIGDLLHFSKLQMEMFFAAMVVYEALLTSCIHMYAWSVSEVWYAETDEGDAEKQPLAKKNPGKEKGTNPFAAFAAA